jgi:putative ABC transport system ATP-binding protein
MAGVTPLFELVGVVVRRGDRTVLDGVDATVPPGVITVIVGPSRSGKSTLLRLCNRLVVPDQGTVLHGGTPLDRFEPTALRRRVGMVFQRPVTLPGTIEDNLRAARAATTDELVAALGRVGLDEPLDRDASSLSGGEAQRMCVARTLLTDPAVVLFDEPTSALDPAATAGIEVLARRLVEDGTSCLWVTHDLDQMRALADHVLFVDRGRVRRQGPRSEVLTDPGPELADFLEGDR